MLFHAEYTVLQGPSTITEHTIKVKEIMSKMKTENPRKYCTEYTKRLQLPINTVLQVKGCKCQQYGGL